MAGAWRITLGAGTLKVQGLSTGGSMSTGSGAGHEPDSAAHLRRPKVAEVL